MVINKINKLVVSSLAVASLLTGAVTTSAYAAKPVTIQKESNNIDTGSLQSHKDIEIINNIPVTYVAIDENSQLLLKDSELRKINRDIILSGTSTSQVTPFSIPTEEGWETVGSLKDNNLQNLVKQTMFTILKNSINSIVNNIAEEHSENGWTTTAINAVTNSATDFMVDNVSYDWTTTRLVKSYSSYYGEYTYQNIHYVYADQSRTQLKSVFVGEPELKRFGAYFHPKDLGL